MDFRSSNTGTLARCIYSGVLGYVLYLSWPYVGYGQPNEWAVYAFGLGTLAFAVGALDAVQGLATCIHKSIRTFRAHRPKLAKNAAGWLTRKKAMKAGSGKTKGIFLGLLDGLPLFVPDAVHTLVCAPARTGKTISAVLPMLCHDIGCSRLVADMKGELVVITARLIARFQGHRVIVLNPAHKFGLRNWCYNPVQIILDALESSPQDVISDAVSMAKQLVQTPPGGDRDPFWPNGTRKLIVFVVVALCVLRDALDANLPRAYEVLGDDEEFDGLLDAALESDALAGELATLARNIINTRSENPKHFESFREGAIQALMPFGPSGHLAASMDRCDFRFRDLKNDLITLFMLSDYSRNAEYAPWLGLLVWAALKELVREDNDVPVRFCLDEFTNYRLPELPNALTALAGYGIRISMIVQELREVARAYGNDALATILSQTDVKQFFGISSLETAQMVSQMLGEKDVAKESYNFGDDLFGLSGLGLGSMKAPMMTPDQLRRLPEDEQIIFIKNLPPARALKAGYQEVSPWREKADGNPLHQGKRFLGEVKMVMKGRYAYATHHGRRKVEDDRGPLIWPLLLALKPFVPDKSAVFPAALVFVVMVFGWPQLRLEYASNMSWCRYQGIPFVSEPVTLMADNCPLIVWRK